MCILRDAEHINGLGDGSWQKSLPFLHEGFSFDWQVKFEHSSAHNPSYGSMERGFSSSRGSDAFV